MCLNDFQHKHKLCRLVLFSYLLCVLQGTGKVSILCLNGHSVLRQQTYIFRLFLEIALGLNTTHQF